MIAGKRSRRYPFAHGARYGRNGSQLHKWDAQPKTLDEALAAIHRAYNEAVTPPMAPTLVVMDSELQKMDAPNFRLPDVQAAGSSRRSTRHRERNRQSFGGRAKSADRRRVACAPARRDARCPTGRIGRRSTSTTAANGPMSFPQRHPLQGPGADTNYDYVLGLETARRPGIHHRSRSAVDRRQRDPRESASAASRTPAVMAARGTRTRPANPRSSDHGRCRGQPADDHRRSEAANDRRQTAPRAGSHRQARGSESGGARRRPSSKPWKACGQAGTEARSARLASTPNCGRSS